MSTPFGAHSQTGRRKPLAWPWLVLLILALVIAAIIVIVANVNDDNDTGALDTASPVALVISPVTAAA